MSNEHIEKGRNLLRMKVSGGKHLENPNSDLLKIPLEVLHSLALQQIGEQESYIEELEEKLHKLTANVNLTRKENVRIAEETRKEKVISDIWWKFCESQQKNGKVRKKYNELCSKYSYALTKIEMLEEKLKQYENQTNQ